MKTAPVKTGVWTEHEDLLLLEYQAIYGNKWSQISQHIPGRNGQQVAQRWRHKVNPNIVKDKWTSEEDSLLTKLVQELGVGKWARVARHLPGRTDQQCMGRWRRHLDPNIRKDAWTAEEDARLQALYQEHGSSWSMIAKSITNRTPQQCRGRWCILTSSRSKEAVQAAPEAPASAYGSQSRKGQDAASAAAVEAARHGRAKPQASASMRPEAVTELPAMPASATVPTPAGGDLPQPPAARTTRMTRSRTHFAAAGSTVPDTPTGTGRRERRPCVLQDPGSVEARAAAEKVPSQEVGQEEAAEANSSGATRGRLLLGTRVLSFRRRSRSTQRRPRTRLAVLALPAGGTPPPANGSAEKPEVLERAAAAAVELLPPLPRQPPEAIQLPDDEEKLARLQVATTESDPADRTGAGCTCQGGEGGPATGGAASLPCEAARGAATTVVASTCKRPTVSTSSRSGLVDSLNGSSRQRPAGRTEAAPDDSLLHMSTRKTRSGRCYPMGTTPAVPTAKPSCPEQLSQGLAGIEAPTEALATTADGQAGCSSGPSHELSASVRPSTVCPGQRNSGDAAASQLPGALAGEAVVVVPDFDLFAAQAAALDVGSPQGDNEPQQATPGASANTSLGLPEGLFSTAVSPAGNQSLNWQEVIGSPPTSSFLAFVEAGLLQTPSVVRGPSPGPDMLRAPVPPGLPKVTPGFSNEWSDVPALSWTELQACQGGFGIIGRQLTASAQGTPDNSRPALRPVKGNGGAGVTPRRDMYVRPALAEAGPGSASGLALLTSGCMLRLGAVELAGEGEGQGDTRSLPPSPSDQVPGVKTAGGCARGNNPDQAMRGDDRDAPRMTETPGRLPQPYAAVASTMNAAGGRMVPDFCSPAKKPDVAFGRLPVGPLERFPGLVSRQAPSAHQGCDPVANDSPLCPPPGMAGVSPHPSIVGPPLSARRPSNAGQLPLRPALANALMPAVAPQPPPGANTAGPSHHRPLTSHLQLPSLPALGTSTHGAAGFTPAGGSFGGLVAPIGAPCFASNAPAGALPRLELPKPPMAGTMRSLFPVLSLRGYQSGKENVPR